MLVVPLRAALLKLRQVAIIQRMRSVPIDATDEEIKNVVREWVALLAEQKYAEALEMLSPEVLSGNGSIDKRDAEWWTPELIEVVIGNYGLPEPIEGEEHKYEVVPVVIPDDDSMQEAFENKLQVYRREFTEDGHKYVGSVRVDLPLAYEEYDALSDLTAKFFLRSANDEIVLVLVDIHVW
jgi:hypothetical protein